MTFAAKLKLIDALSAATVVTRKAAHTLAGSDPEAKLLRDAVKVLKDRGNGPTGWARMSLYHRDFCATPDRTKQVHFTWTFLPWHRFYLAIVERHLQLAVSEPALALPYWDWYAYPKIPDIYLGANNTLVDSSRTAAPGAQMEVDDFGNATAETDLSGLQRFDDFGGDSSTSGSLEQGPHNGGHGFVGGNMSTFATAAVDPIFYAHHGNVDRLWEVWKNAAPNRKNPATGSDWDSKTHSFVDADGTMRNWKSGEAVSTEALGYRYDTIAPKGPIVTASAELAAPASAPVEVKIPLATANGQNENYSLGANGLAVKPKLAPLPDTLAAPLSDAKTSDLLKARKLFLLIQGIKVPPEAAYIHVHINFADNVTQLTRQISRESQSYAGSAVLVPAGAGTEPTIDLKVELTGRARSIATPIADLNLSIIPFSAAGQPLSESTSIQGLQLLME